MKIKVIWKFKWFENLIDQIFAISPERPNIWMIWKLKWFENLIDPNFLRFHQKDQISEWFENQGDLKIKVIWKFNWSKNLRFHRKDLISEWFENQGDLILKWFENLIDPDISDFTGKTWYLNGLKIKVIWKLKWFEN